MKSTIISILAIIIVLLQACDGRSGYLDDEQLSAVSVLTGAEWLMGTADYGNGQIYEFDDDTQVYRFEDTGKGWIATGSFSDSSKKEEVSYYQWTFTTRNFTVIYMAGHVVEGYWLIEKLTADELRVVATRQDPVIYPNQNKTVYRFKARKISK